MEVTKRDLIISILAGLIFVAVLVPSLVAVNNNDPKTPNLEDVTTVGEEEAGEIASDDTTTNSGEEKLETEPGEITITNLPVDGNTVGEEESDETTSDDTTTNSGKEIQETEPEETTITTLPEDETTSMSPEVTRNPKILNFAADIKKNQSTACRVAEVLSKAPLIDGHNDFPWSIRNNAQNKVELVPFHEDLTKLEPWASDPESHTDLMRLRKGKVGGQFWSAYMPCSTQCKDAVKLFLEQVDVIHQLVEKYPGDLRWADSARGIEQAFAAGKIASLIGVESGHALDSSMGVLRTLYREGARYLTLTHSCNTPWADAAQAESGEIGPGIGGISEFGEKLVWEMNRLGMMVDLAHVSKDTMISVLNITKAPVIFSHSGARGVATNVRNVPDEVLKKLKETGGVVMLNFFSCYLIDDCETRNASISDVVKHINHIREVAGVDHVGIGGDYNGVDKFPIGLEDVSSFPKVFEALIDDTASGIVWSDEDLAKLAGGNLLSVFKEVERVRDRLAENGEGHNGADNTWMEQEDREGHTACMSV